MIGLFYSMCVFSQDIKIDTTKNQDILVGKPGITLPTNVNKENKPFRTTCGASITKDDMPLYVVDDEIVSFDQIKVIDEKTIKTINVLKGAAAAALYGVAGQYGVVYIITNKKSEND